MCAGLCVSIHIYIYLYIDVYRKRSKLVPRLSFCFCRRSTHLRLMHDKCLLMILCTCVGVCVCVYIYMFIYMYRKRSELALHLPFCFCRRLTRLRLGHDKYANKFAISHARDGCTRTTSMLKATLYTSIKVLVCQKRP